MEIDWSALEEYMLDQGELSPSTIEKYLVELKAFFSLNLWEDDPSRLANNIRGFVKGGNNRAWSQFAFRHLLNYLGKPETWKEY